MITCNHGPTALCGPCQIDLLRHELATIKSNYANLKEDLIYAHKDVDILKAKFSVLNARNAEIEKWYSKPTHSHGCIHNHNNTILVCETCGIRAHKETEAKLAEVMPVVEAAVAWAVDLGPGFLEEQVKLSEKLDEAVRNMLATKLGGDNGRS